MSDRGTVLGGLFFLLFAAFWYLAVPLAIIYAAFHFICKFW